MQDLEGQTMRERQDFDPTDPEEAYERGYLKGYREGYREAMLAFVRAFEDGREGLRVLGGLPNEGG